MGRGVNKGQERDFLRAYLDTHTSGYQVHMDQEDLEKDRIGVGDLVKYVAKCAPKLNCVGRGAVEHGIFDINESVVVDELWTP